MPRRAFRLDDETLDRCSEAYQAEFVLWRIVRRGGGEHDYQLIREPRLEASTLAAPISDSVTMEIIRCDGARSYTDAEVWLDTHRGRASMRAALEAL